MKNFIFISLLFLATNHSLCQIPDPEIDESAFFKYLNSINTFNGFSNNQINIEDAYKDIKSDFSVSSNLLQKLEIHLSKQETFKIYPQDSIIIGQDTIYEIDIRRILIVLCYLNQINNSNVEKRLAEFKNPFTLSYLYYDLNEAYFNNQYKSQFDSVLYALPQLTKEQNLQLLAARMDMLDCQKYMYYESYRSTPHLFKGFELQHDNDILAKYTNNRVGISNQDRELTGGFKFTILTDYMKWRFLRYKKDNNIQCDCLKKAVDKPIMKLLSIFADEKESDVLTYQTISIVGSGYTPYIRYRNNFELADSLHKYDRPFSSFLLIERAKHRTWRKGRIRHKGEFQIGAIGISQGRKIQAKLHADVNTSSQFVHGWDNQIANGGRLVLQLNHNFDFLLYSNTNKPTSIFSRRNKRMFNPIDKYFGKNIFGELDLRVGTLMTTAGVGVRFSTLDFLKQSGNNMIVSWPKSKNEVGFKFDIGLNYRYVVHNSLLEGLGLFKTFKTDPYDQVPIDNYILRKDEIDRNMFIVDFGITFRMRKTALFYRVNYYTLEYFSKMADVNLMDSTFTDKLNPDDEEFYANKVVPELINFGKPKFFGKPIYSYGTIGFSWILDKAPTR